MEAPAVVELDWSEPFLIEGVRCRAATLDGEWLIASSQSPRFCFHGATREEAESTAIRAMKFWAKFKRATD